MKIGILFNFGILAIEHIKRNQRVSTCMHIKCVVERECCMYPSRGPHSLKTKCLQQKVAITGQSSGQNGKMAIYETTYMGSTTTYVQEQMRLAGRKRLWRREHEYNRNDGKQKVND